MNRPVRTGKDSDEARGRILEAAEEQFRRVGYHRTSVADIAAQLGMSPANIYRFFPSRDAINESICGRVVNEVADIASAIARNNAPALIAQAQTECVRSLLLQRVHHRDVANACLSEPAGATKRFGEMLGVSRFWQGVRCHINPH
jgi:AcrR family transcriptional regulator